MNRSTPRAFLKTLDAPTLVRYLRKYIQRSLVVGSIEAHLLDEAAERLEGKAGGEHDQQR